MTSCSYGYVFLVRKVNSKEHYLVIALKAQPTGVKKMTNTNYTHFRNR